VSEEDSLPADGKEVAAGGFVGEKIHGYSWRSAFTGSSREAMRAGM
jgi:hypothetical protein